MKSQKTNAFQLAIAGGVLVLVLVCATFAWFAVGDHAWVSKITASLASPDVPSQLNSIEYHDGSEWVGYNGGHLDIQPGQVYSFRVKFTAKEDDRLTMALSDISASLREPESAEDNGDEVIEETTRFQVVTEENMLSDVLHIKLNKGEYVPIPSDGVIVNNKVVDPSCKVENSPQYVYEYQIKMLESADNTYAGKKLSFVMAVSLPDGAEGDNAQAEG
ncbi:MAG: hypothetical protein IKK09_00925 [Clostridia bacterium]|nr:hypothetical protein [Clostridia bacterium]